MIRNGSFPNRRGDRNFPRSVTRSLSNRAGSSLVWKMARIFVENRRNGGGQHAIREEIISPVETSGIRFVSRFRRIGEGEENLFKTFDPYFKRLASQDLTWLLMKADTLENFDYGSLIPSFGIRLCYNDGRDIWIICTDRHCRQFALIKLAAFMIIRSQFCLFFREIEYFIIITSDVYDLDLSISYSISGLSRYWFEIICHVYIITQFINLKRI